jgi:hypothetical protein
LDYEFVVAAQLFPGQYPGTISAPPDVARLISAAHLVCRGGVVRIETEGVVQYQVGVEKLLFNQKAASVQVHQVYLGGAEAGTLIDVEFLEPDIPAALTTLADGEEAVLFLVGAGLRYRLVDFASAKISLTKLAPSSVKGILDRAAASSDDHVSSVARALVADLFS